MVDHAPTAKSRSVLDGARETMRLGKAGTVTCRPRVSVRCSGKPGNAAPRAQEPSSTTAMGSRMTTLREWDTTLAFALQEPSSTLKPSLGGRRQKRCLGLSFGGDYRACGTKRKVRQDAVACHAVGLLCSSVMIELGS